MVRVSECRWHYVHFELYCVHSVFVFRQCSDAASSRAVAQPDAIDSAVTDSDAYTDAHIDAHTDTGLRSRYKTEQHELFL